MKDAMLTWSFVPCANRVLGAVMFTVVGIVFLRSDMKPPMEPELDSSQRKGMGKARNELYKNVLLGVTMSGINPALLATYTGAIASGSFPKYFFRWF